MIIEEDYVTLEQAKRLKDKGFDSECITAYYTNGKESETDYVYYDSPRNWNWSKYKASRPTHQMVLKWFRENHKIHIQPEPYWCEDGMLWLAKIFKIEDGFTALLKTVMVNDTCEDAVSAAIDYVINDMKNIRKNG